MSSSLSVFVDNKGEPVKFYIVTGPTYVTEQGGLTAVRAKNIRTKIERYGGKVVGDIDDASVWVVNDGVLDTYKRYCMDDPDHRAVGTGFVQRCIDLRTFQDEWVENKRTMAGRYPGKRSHFSPEEEELLCEWIAMKIPDPSAGGRFGVKIYQMLVEQGEQFPSGRWGLANNHPMQSWKEHYKKNSLRLNQRINQIVEQKGYTAEAKTAYKNDRRLNKRTRRIDDDQAGEDDPDLQGEFSASEEEEEPPQKRRKVFAREEEEEEEDPDAVEPLRREPSFNDEGRGVNEPSQDDAPGLQDRRQGHSGSAGGTAASPSSNTQRTLVNPTPRASRTYSRRTNSGSQPKPYRPSTEIESEDEDEDEDIGSARTALAASSSRIRPDAVGRRDENESQAGSDDPGDGAIGGPVYASNTTSESARQVEHDLSEDEPEVPGSFVTETDDARAREDVFADDSGSEPESENPFEASVTDDT